MYRLSGAILLNKNNEIYRLSSAFLPVEDGDNEIYRLSGAFLPAEDEDNEIYRLGTFLQDENNTISRLRAAPFSQFRKRIMKFTALAPSTEMRIMKITALATFSKIRII